MTAVHTLFSILDGQGRSSRALPANRHSCGSQMAHSPSRQSVKVRFFVVERKRGANTLARFFTCRQDTPHAPPAPGCCRLRSARAGPAAPRQACLLHDIMRKRWRAGRFKPPRKRAAGPAPRPLPPSRSVLAQTVRPAASSVGRKQSAGAFRSALSVHRQQNSAPSSRAASGLASVERGAGRAKHAARGGSKFASLCLPNSVYVWVVGRVYRPENQAGLNRETPLRLVPEPQNRFDPNAVAVEAAVDDENAWRKIGFIEARLARAVSKRTAALGLCLSIEWVPPNPKARMPCLLTWRGKCAPLTAEGKTQRELGSDWARCLSRAPRVADKSRKRKGRSLGAPATSLRPRLRQATLFSPLLRKPSKTGPAARASWDRLPRELLELAFFHLDAETDAAAARCVCRAWRTTLTDFMPHRTAHRRGGNCATGSTSGAYSDKCASFRQVMADLGPSGALAVRLGLDKHSEALEQAVRSVLPREALRTLEWARKNSHAYPPPRASDDLSSSSSSTPQGSVNPVTIVASGASDLVLLILLSSSMALPGRLRGVIANACMAGALRRHVLVDALYCLAAVFSRVGFSHNRRAGYDLQSALCGLTLSFPVFEGSVRLTAEQARIVRHEVPDGKVLKVIACAGSGKTTLLRAYARARPDKRFLYVTYNASVGLEAQATFPSNVRCRNIHKIAFRYDGRRYKHKLRGDFSFTGKYGDVVSEALVHRMVQRYLISADAKIGEEHVRVVLATIKGRSPTPASDWLARARRYWDAMQNLSDRRTAMTHDGYLKLYHLSRPRLDAEYDAILIDEAQDCNDVICDILLSQKVPIFVVGDPNQQIYSFLGGTGLLERIPAARTFRLTRSFRFGGSLAYLSTLYLRHFEKASADIVGASKETLVVNDAASDSGATPISHGDTRHTCICRTNVGVFREAAEAVLSKSAGCRIGFVGGVESQSFGAVLDSFRLVFGHWGEIQSRKVRRLATAKHRRETPEQAHQRLLEYADATHDSELKGACEIMRLYGDRIPHIVRRVRKAAVKDSRTAHLVLTTVHKAKGLEWDCVRLDSDFTDLFSHHAARAVADDPAAFEEEIHVLYVAITRAKRVLWLDAALSRWVRFSCLGAGRILPRICTYSSRSDSTHPCFLCGSRQQQAPEHAPDTVSYVLDKTGSGRRNVCACCASRVIG